MKLCDLHTHSTSSDGSLTPNELVALGLEANLSVLALCDHNTTAGLEEFTAAASDTGLIAVPGVEVSSVYNDTELHILGLFLPRTAWEPLETLLRSFKVKKEQSNLEMIERLNQAGYQISYAAIPAQHPNRYLNRAHIALELTRLGYTQSVNQAFRDLLSPEGEFYREPERLQALDVISILKEMGAVPVLAHPFLNLTEPELRVFLSLVLPVGLAGMEVFYSTYDEDTTRRSLAITEEFALLPSGGSDFHGIVKPDIAIGTGKGNLQIPFSCFEALAAYR